MSLWIRARLRDVAPTSSLAGDAALVNPLVFSVPPEGRAKRYRPAVCPRLPTMTGATGWGRTVPHGSGRFVRPRS